MTRASGINVPLFSLVTTRSWGVGEFADLVDSARWAAGAGQSLIQILPVMELPEFQCSPYSALSSFALDPTYIAVPLMADFAAIGGMDAFDAADREALDEVRGAPGIAYLAVRRLKDRWLRRAWEHFARVEMPKETDRARAFDAYCTREADWLDDYAVFRALLASHRDLAWWDWPAPEGTGSDEVVARARTRLGPDIAYRKYLQWIADQQWAEARQIAGPTRVFGDLPFMISGNSADVWRRQNQFRLDATVGAPPDAFSEDGQDWGLPPWRWQAFRDAGFDWMHLRARRHADLFDGFRIDHLVGLYRAWVRPLDTQQPPFFDPAEESTQRALGETLVGVFTGSGAEIIAEDLGTIPDFVRESLSALGVPGFKVLRWERHWDEPGEPPIDPAHFPACSVATTGTHDVAPLAAEFEPDEAERALRDVVASGSYLALLPIQDVFGWTARINTPGVVSDENWTWRVPRPVDEWDAWPEARARQTHLADLTRAAGR